MTYEIQPGQRLADPSAMDDLNLTDDEAALELFLTKSTLADWRSSGRGPRYIKLGRRVLYRLGDLRAYVASRAVDPATKNVSPARKAARRL